MELTEEQRNIISSEGDIKINAVAGSGKTTTVIEYAKTRPKHSRIFSPIRHISMFIKW